MIFRKNNFIEKQNNLLTKSECQDIISWVFANKNINPHIDIETSGYHDCLLYKEEIFELPELKKLSDAIIKLKKCYVENYPEVDNTYCVWDLDYVQFKWWKPGSSFSKWHSDNGGSRNEDFKRILSFLIYLSDNDCSTEFRRYGNFKTQSGTGIMFPTFFTHEHRGSVCKMGLDRFVVGGYFSFLY